LLTKKDTEISGLTNGERFAIPALEDKIPLKEGKFDIGDFKDPMTKDKHTELYVTLVERRGKVDPDVRLHIRRQGSKTVLGGGYPEESGDYMKFATPCAGVRPLAPTLGQTVAPSAHRGSATAR
jgi:hypothetical protein